MTIWDFISRTADSLKQNAPDLTAAKNLFSSVSGNGGRRCRQDYFNHYVQEEEALSNMVLFGTIVAKNATQESLKAIPGASVAYKIVTKSVQDINNSDKLQVDAKASNMITLEKKPLKTASYTSKHKEICQVQI